MVGQRLYRVLFGSPALPAAEEPLMLRLGPAGGDGSSTSPVGLGGIGGSERGVDTHSGRIRIPASEYGADERAHRKMKLR